MFKHNLTLAVRNFKKHKSMFFINLTGLTTGIACTLLIYMWVIDELSIDKFHKYEDRIYQVMEYLHYSEGTRTHKSTSGFLAQSMEEEFPEIERAVSIAAPFLIDDMVLNHDQNIFKGVGQFVGRDFFNVFTYVLKKGTPDQVLKDKNSIVLSESMALKLFGKIDESVIGKQIQWESEEMTQTVIVAGIFENVPSNSSSQFDFVLSYEHFLGQDDTFHHWGNYGPYAFLLLKEGTDLNSFNEKIKNYLDSKGIEGRELFIQQYSDNYLYGTYKNGKQAGGRIEYVRLFSIIAIVILVIACINFMNLSTARGSTRMKEVGVKKTLGANRYTLMWQYFIESLAISFVSLALAVLMMTAILPTFNDITGKSIGLSFDIYMVVTFIGITVITGLLAGVYPALYLSKFNPIMVLKGKLNTSFGEVWARRGLVLVQFTISIILIVAVVIIHKQVDYVQNKSIGYDKDRVLQITPNGKSTQKLETFISEIKRVPGVKNASAIGHSLVKSGFHTYNLDWEGKDPNHSTRFEIAEVTHELFETLELELKSGRTFSSDFGSEHTKVVCNEKAIESMAMKGDPIGKHFTLWGDDMEVIGVVKDFHFESMRKHIKPMIFIFDPSEADDVILRIEKGREAETLVLLREFHDKFNPGYEFDYKFLKDDYEAQYKSEQRVSTISEYFAGIAILISCLGLFGLATFSAERRAKEIGIRKILGSSLLGIIRLLTLDFTRIVGLAILIALPLSYLIAQYWLNGFAYRVQANWWLFLGIGIMVLVLSWIVVGWQTLKAALINPAEFLRDE
ncbi:MAG: ABC transporter permease [bacterium]|nr:ABC transporter permease [bacterium]